MKAHLTASHEELMQISGFEALSPQNGTAFHCDEDLKLFLDNPRQGYIPNSEVSAALSGITIGTIGGAFGVGKNAAKAEAVNLSMQTPPYKGISKIHPVISGTTRIPQFRDGRLEEEGIDYLFAFEYDRNRRLADLLREGKLVQYAQPRGDDVYFTEIQNYPVEEPGSFAIIDAVPDTIIDLNRVLSPFGKSATGMYRTAFFEQWMSQIRGRGDVVDSKGKAVDPVQYKKRMSEACKSITQALDLRGELDIRFFEAQTRTEAGKAVVNILLDEHPRSKQIRAEKAAMSMLKGLKNLGFKPK